jgi:hypothetical protein
VAEDRVRAEIAEFAGKTGKMGQSQREAMALCHDAMASSRDATALRCPAMALHGGAMALSGGATASRRGAVELRLAAMALRRVAAALPGMTIDSCRQLTQEGWTKAVQPKKYILATGGSNSPLALAWFFN